jgi:hypothetical protein
MLNGDVLTILLQPGETLLITTDASAAATVLRLPDTPGGSVPYQTWTVAANTTGKIGPFVNPKRLQITIANGSATYAAVKLETGQGALMKVVNTNGTTPVNVFDANGAPAAFTIKSVISVALDTTAGNIVTKNAGNTVATIAKGIVAGVPVGASSLANTAVAASASFTVESSSAGNSTVIIGMDPA